MMVVLTTLTGMWLGHGTRWTEQRRSSILRWREDIKRPRYGNDNGGRQRAADNSCYDFSFFQTLSRRLRGGDSQFHYDEANINLEDHSTLYQAPDPLPPEAEAEAEAEASSSPYNQLAIGREAPSSSYDQLGTTEVHGGNDDHPATRMMAANNKGVVEESYRNVMQYPNYMLEREQHSDQDPTEQQSMIPPDAPTYAVDDEDIIARHDDDVLPPPPPRSDPYNNNNNVAAHPEQDVSRILEENFGTEEGAILQSLPVSNNDAEDLHRQEEGEAMEEEEEEEEEEEDIGLDDWDEEEKEEEQEEDEHEKKNDEGVNDASVKSEDIYNNGKVEAGSKNSVNISSSSSSNSNSKYFRNRMSEIDIRWVGY
eukprot:jgi/Bigna1/127894/aug1.5_g2602